MTFDITIHGRGGHGSRPDLSHNPIDCFAAVHAAMQQLPGGFEISKAEGGTSNNIIPNDLRFTCFCSDPDAEQLKNILNNLCSIYHCTVKFN